MTTRAVDGDNPDDSGHGRWQDERRPRTMPSTEAAWGGGSVNRPIRAIALAIPTLAMLLVIASAVLFTQDGVFGGDPVSNALGWWGSPATW